MLSNKQRYNIYVKENLTHLLYEMFNDKINLKDIEQPGYDDQIATLNFLKCLN